MTPRQVLLTPRWAAAAGLVVLAVALCIVLGLWQFHRFEDRSEGVTTIARNFDAAPVALSTVLPSANSALTADDDYRVVEAHGTYCASEDCVLYVRNRPLGSSVGFWQVAPFTTDDGMTVLVVRGWVPASSTESAPGAHPEIPEGPITLTARLRPAERQLTDRDQIDGQLQSVNAADVQAQVPNLPHLATGAYGIMADENGPGTGGIEVPQALARPETTRGPHLSYAFQWWVFALFFPIALVVTARRALADARTSDVEAPATARGSEHSGQVPTEQSGHPERRASQRGRPQRESSQRRARARSRDEEDEDAFLDEREHL